MNFCYPEPENLVIVSRESRLAMWQASHVRDNLKRLYPKCDVTILGITTRGDQILDRSLNKVGGKGLFVKELEIALSDGRADLAVHSLKDVPMQMPDGFMLGAIMTREDPRDAFVSNNYESLEGLPAGAIVGTSSLRREMSLRTHYPHLKIEPLRGNLDTRLNKLDRGNFSAIVLAAAGLKRLGLTSRIRKILTPEMSLPAAGQGAIGIEICSARTELKKWLAPLHHTRSALAVTAERALSRELGGSCQIPLAAFAKFDGDILLLRAFIAAVDASQTLSANAESIVVDVAGAEGLGKNVAQQLIDVGARALVLAAAQDITPS
ncbi:hydroxymethylbilane synthase [Candidatus Pandoraea novymonadis]|uniref:Porphobilinogen deaminase n=1 Tax=Candidatus Pandoraea novymonadis TaxID=1808959 RepID=A0ABX5FF89_9BURK|nr:hydroxymethylbilane synthase [Candidatus Pandoraea novymonadis]PSB91996.1 Porphobilinogen deaminase [Candidatus Pandoraea novymonadis]